jgi:hypothetical protein
MKHLLEEFSKQVLQMKRDITQLKQNILRNVVIPSDGKFILPHHSTNPTAENGKMYYNTTTHKARVCENGTWRDV